MRVNIMLIIGLLFFACKPQINDSEVQVLYDQVIEIHDEVMPEISTINKLQRKIRKLPEQNDNTVNMLTELQAADDGMMDWMEDFQAFKKMKDAPKLEKLDYLGKEKVKIQQVSIQMKEAISKAKTLLNE